MASPPPATNLDPQHALPSSSSLARMDPALMALPSSSPDLHDDEEIQSRSFEGIGLYSKNTKLPAPLDLLTAQVTSHRILLFPPVPLPSSPAAHGVSLALADVRSTEFYAGFLKSSAKVTLLLTTASRSDADALNGAGSTTATGWTCGVCGFGNAPSPAGAADRLVSCTMCGISRDRSLLASTISAVRAPAGGIPHSRPLSAAGTHSSPPVLTGPTPSPSPRPDDQQIACPTCTFLNSPLLIACEICTTPLPKRPLGGAPAPLASTAQSPAATAAAAPPSVDSVIRLSFRRGGEKEFYAILKRALGSKAWSGGQSRTMAASSAVSSTTAAASAVPTSGIDRILSTMSVQDASRTDSISSSLRDLESLMAKASEMVKLASTLSSRLPASLDPTSTAGPTAILASPAITQDMMSSSAASEEAYLRELARELAGLLTGKDGLMVDGVVRARGNADEKRKGRGMLGLDEVWCVWNRARGVALIPPKTFRSTLPYLPALTSPSITLRTFRSSAHCVLHTPFFSAPAFRARLLTALAPTPSALLPSMSTIELALAEDVGVGLVKEMVEELEADKGEVVRDAQAGTGGGERWYRNLISCCTWVEVNVFT